MLEIDRTADLIQRIVDGEATRAERAELDALMSASAATRADYESLRDLVRRLDIYPMAEAPRLREEILAKLRGRAVVSFHTRRRRAVFGIAWAAAAAVIVGIALDQFRNRERLEPDHAAATMNRAPASAGGEAPARRLKPAPREAGAPLSWPVVAQQRSEGATLTLRVHGDFVAATLEPVEPGSEVSWEPHQLTFSTIGPGTRYDGANKQRGVVVFNAPEDQVTVVLRRVLDARGPALVRVARSGQEILKTSIPSE
jgi:hypothetical protein